MVVLVFTTCVTVGLEDGEFQLGLIWLGGGYVAVIVWLPAVNAPVVYEALPLTKETLVALKFPIESLNWMLPFGVALVPGCALHVAVNVTGTFCVLGLPLVTMLQLGVALLRVR